LTDSASPDHTSGFPFDGDRPISAIVKAMALLVAAGAMETAGKKQKASEDILRHRPGVAVAARGRDGHLTVP